MLLELSIRNFAIIENLAVSFGRGLNIFTGETGAGKSIIIDAIALVLGDRATNEIIRTSEEEAQVEALFDSSANKAVKRVLEEAGIEHSDSLIIKRIIQRSGRNKIYINGSLATLVTLTEVGRRLIDICGQSEHQSLTRPEEHAEVLDSFGSYPELRSRMADAYRVYLDAKKDLDRHSQDSKNISERRDMLQFITKELGEAGLRQGEEEELTKDRERLRHAEKLKSAAQNAEKVMYSESGSVCEKLGSVIKHIKDAAALDERLAGTAGALEGSLFSIEEAARELRSYAEGIEHDPDALEKLESRLDRIHKLKKKYSMTVAELIDKQSAAAGELSNLENSSERLKGLEAALKEARDKAAAAAEVLGAARKKAAAELKARIEKELQSLGMKGAAFEVALDKDKYPDGTPRFGEKGYERVSFNIAPNKGEGAKPLARIASGGELSRIMLAMKRAVAEGRVPTIVFDEVDAGVGGSTAQVVGQKLKEVSRSHQVICVTHLPQITAFADTHYAVDKHAAPGGRTVTSVKELKGDERIEQISWMLAGTKVTDVTRKHARELVETAASIAGKRQVKQAAGSSEEG